MPSGSPGRGSTTTSAARNSCSPHSSGTSARTPRTSSVRSGSAPTSAPSRSCGPWSVGWCSSAPEHQSASGSSIAPRPRSRRKVAALHLKARREVLAEMRTIIEEGVSRGEFRPRDERLAALSVIGMCNWVAWWFHPGSNHPAEPVADQLAQNAVDMLSYPEGTGPLTTTPHRALQMVRENLDYLERFLGPDSGHHRARHRPAEAQDPSRRARGRDQANPVLSDNGPMMSRADIRKRNRRCGRRQE